MTLEEFFRNKARQFTEGEVAASAEGVRLPLVASIVGSTFTANRMEDIVAALMIYRSNLMVEAYARTEITDFQAMEPVGGVVQVIARYRNVNDVGAQIDTFDASFICEELPDGGWEICQADSIADGTTDRFLAGLPLA